MISMLGKILESKVSLRWFGGLGGVIEHTTNTCVLSREWLL